MENKKQIAKGDNIVQSNINVQGDYIVGIQEERVMELIKTHCTVNKEEIIELVKKTIEEIPDEKFILPQKRIFVPVIQKLSYSTDEDIIKSAYLKLLESSMTKEKSFTVHPSFVRIIDELCPDEIKILNEVPLFVSSYKPLIDLRMIIGEQEGNGIIQVSNFTDIGYGICEYPNKICDYIENMERLKIIEIPSMRTLINKEKYQSLENHPAILEVMEKNISTDSIKISYKFDEKCFSLTSFGASFLKCCK